MLHKCSEGCDEKELAPEVLSMHWISFILQIDNIEMHTKNALKECSISIFLAAER